MNTQRPCSGHTLVEMMVVVAILVVGAAISPAAAPWVFWLAFVGVVAFGGAIDVVINIAATAALGDTPGRLVRFHALFNSGVVIGGLTVGILLHADISFRWMWLIIAAVAFALARFAASTELPGTTSGEHSGLLESLRTVHRYGLLLLAIVFGLEILIQRIWPNGERRHRALGTFTMVIYCILFITGSVTYTMLYILYPGKIG